MSSVPTRTDLREAIVDAARRAFSDLFATHAEERFYYCTLITFGEAPPPVVAAWSHEALAAAQGPGVSDEEDVKWSYADAPYYCYGEDYFHEVNRLFQLRPEPSLDDEAAWHEEVALRLDAMESAMARLDQEGLFGSGARRLAMVINVEVMPPDYSNVERALRLNPEEALHEWLREAAEPPR